MNMRQNLTMFLMAISALVLTILPLNALSFLNIDALVVVYALWVLFFPNTCRLFHAWILGLSQDILYGSVLGEHALSLTIVGFILLKLMKRLFFYAQGHQAAFISLLVLMNGFVVMIVELVQAHHHFSFLALIVKSLLTGLFWLAVIVFLSKHRSPLTRI